jgi:putative PIN family toxin of toxin-antitoxin system
LSAVPLASLRVVLDTNIFISAVIFGGRPGEVVRFALRDRYLLLTSEPIRHETERVLAEKFLLPQAAIEQACAALWQSSIQVEPQHSISACPDPDDNRILECALEGNASLIVSGDKHLLRMHPFQGVEIVNVDAFFEPAS